MYIVTLKAKTVKGDYMVYKIRIKAREKQAECNAILFLCFFILFLTAICMNLLPVVYLSLRPILGENPVIDIPVSSLLLALSLVVFGCLSMGADRFMLKRAENIAAGAGDIFYYFTPIRLISLCSFHIRVFFRKALITLLLSGPCVICAGVFYVLSKKGFSLAVCNIFGAFTVAFLFLQLMTYRCICDTFFMERYMFIKGEYLNKKQLLSLAQNYTVPNIGRLRRLKLSFFGWFMLCVFIFPIPYVWAYFRQSKACLASEIIHL